MYRIISVSALTAAAFALSAVSASAADKEGMYVTVGATFLSTELDLTDVDVSGEVLDLGTEDIDVTMLTGRIGYRLNDFFAVEGEVGFGLSGDDFTRVVPVDVLGQNVDVNLDATLDVGSYYIGFARAILPVSEQFEFFGRVGYGQATAEADIAGSALGFTASGSEEQDENGIAYGVGAEFSFTDRDGIRADYTRLEDTNILSLAYSRRF